MIAYRGYDSERVLEKIEECAAVAAVPPKSDRKEQKSKTESFTSSAI